MGTIKEQKKALKLEIKSLRAERKQLLKYIHEVKKELNALSESDEQ